MTPLRLAIIGPGKMGSAIADLARATGMNVVATLGAGSVIDATSLAGADVAIEFTEAGAAAANVRACIVAGCPVVVGTTGWYDELPALSRFVDENGGSLVWAPNF